MERKRNLQRSTKNHQEILIRLLVSERGRNMDRRNAGDLRYKTARKKQLESDQKSKRHTYKYVTSEKRHTYHPEPVTKDDEFALLLSRPIIFQNCFPNIVRFCAAIFYIFPIFYLSTKEKWKKVRGEMKSISCPH